MPREAPLSSAHLVPMTEETKQNALAAGVSLDALAHISEMGAQALLAFQAGEGSDDAAVMPDCFGAEYTPGNVFCDGCVVQPRCWRSDISYLQRLGRGGDNPPPAIPDRVVAARVQWAKEQEDMADTSHVPADQIAALRKLEYDHRQIARMQPSVRAFILGNEQPNRGVSITKNGEFREVRAASVQEILDARHEPASEPEPTKPKRRAPPKRAKRRAPPRRR